MPTNTYVAIDTKTISTAATSVEFTSIPQGYTDLILSVNVTTVSDGEGLSFQVGNGTIDTNTNYSRTLISGANDTNAASFRNSGSSNVSLQYAIGLGSDQPCIYQVHFMNYSNTTTYKTFLINSSTYRGTSTNKSEMMREVALWRSTSAIDRIKLTSTVNMNVGSTFTLYGIANARIGAPKAFGGTITQDTAYTYHTFGASGTFTPTQPLSCDYLVVAGGGGSSSFASGGGTGGGGAGGLRSTVTATGGGGTLENNLSLASGTSYTITVGAGGTYVNGSNGNAGSNSTFSTITATGGGYGAYSGNGGNGGSGGGGYGYPASTYTGGTGTTNQGYAGGNGSTDGATWTASAGGGGAGGAGTTTTSNGFGGAGGVGVSIPIFANVTGTGIDTYYAGGGGGGTTKPGALAGLGGIGGGGLGGRQGQVGSNAIANTGGGGGGAGGAGATVAGNGGSGIVIIRYAN
jgi:hypothetical protein